MYFYLIYILLNKKWKHLICSKIKNMYSNCKYCQEDMEWQSIRALNHSLKCKKCPKNVGVDSNSNAVETMHAE